MAAADGWGASYSFNSISPATNHLLSAKTTLVPGRLPPMPSGTGPLFIWPGLSNGKGDLIQTTLDAWGDNQGACGAATGQWCGETSIFGSFGQLSGPSAAFDPDDHITIEYKLGSDNTTWTQTMTSMKLGKVVSTYARASGAMEAGGFGFATEADQDSYTIDAQYYLCTEFHLAAADPTWGSKSGGGNGAKYGATGTGSGPGTAKNLRTPDGGLTWLVDLITLPAMNPQGAQTPPPTIDCQSSGAGGSGGSAGSGGTGGKGGSAGSGGALTTGGTSGGRPNTGGGSSGLAGSVGSGGTVPMGGSSAGASSSGVSGTPGIAGSGGATVSTGGQLGTTGGTSAAGTGSAMAGGSGGQSGLGDNGGSTDDGSCSCSVPGKGRGAQGLLAVALGAALALSRRRSLREWQ
ncbi:MAG: MYXO-CTERM sorting domain-containing protein [Myxococcales bacterium]